MHDIQFTQPIQMPEYTMNPQFGTVFTPHALKLEIGPGNIFGNIEIVALDELNIPPTIQSMHYAQIIFEGMKAYKKIDGSVGIFRPDLHAKRFSESAKKLNMAQFPPELFLKCIRAFVDFEKENVPDFPEHALYLRPMMFASDRKLKVSRSESYSFYILGCVVGNYFSSGGHLTNAKVMVNRDFVRAFPGGLGEVKAAANYALSIQPQSFASQYGCDQVLYLDSSKHEYIDELGGMNFFAIREDQLITPPLTGCILPGVTRKSLLELASKVGLKPIEEELSFAQLKEDILIKKVTEIFACGTAAVVQPIGEIIYMETSTSKPEKITINSSFKKSIELRNLLVGIQRGRIEDPNHWMLNIKMNNSSHLFN